MFISDVRNLRIDGVAIWYSDIELKFKFIIIYKCKSLPVWAIVFYFFPRLKTQKPDKKIIFIVLSISRCCRANDHKVSDKVSLITVVRCFGHGAATDLVAARLAGERSTTEPPMHISKLIIFNILK